MERRRLHLAVACACPLALASCGGGERQDKNEPKGTFKVEVVKASFPSQQKLAKRSDLVLAVKNTGRKTVPNIAVSVHGFDKRLDTRGLADPTRPQFVINGVPKDIGTFPESKEATPEGGETAYVGTWALGKLKPGRVKTFRWSVTAIMAGPYRLTYKVAAGLDGKAKAAGLDGRPPQGLFIGTVKDAPPQSRVDSGDGRTVVEGVR